jgi:hypothetical protein
MQILWFVHRLSQTLPQEALAELQCELRETMFDEWLFEVVPTVRAAFREEWVVRHCLSCRMCSERFCSSLDGEERS